MKIFTLTFSEPENVTNPGQDGVQYSYPFTMVESSYISTPEQRSQTQKRRFISSITGTRLAGWHLSDSDLPKILFEFGRRHIVSLIESRSLPDDNTIRCPMITNASHPEPECPFDPVAISRLWVSPYRSSNRIHRLDSTSSQANDT
jgi:hypothetical protein